MTSRRESRVSMTSRQNDALSEFENFKKRFLVVNKQITKLNSSMSVRIEELNAQISVLYTENLRLRACGIALETQLKREKEKSRSTFVQVEAALNKQLRQLRQSLDISSPDHHSSSPPPQVIRAHTRPTIDPTAIRLSRQPAVSDISEQDDEAEHECDDSESHSDDPQRIQHHRHRHRETTSTVSTKKRRLSASKLPLPSRALSPAPTPAAVPPAPTPFHTPASTPIPTPLIPSSIPASNPEFDIGTSSATHSGTSTNASNSTSKSTKRKSGRRQSGLVDQPKKERERPPSPAFGSPHKGTTSPDTEYPEEDEDALERQGVVSDREPSRNGRVRARARRDREREREEREAEGGEEEEECDLESADDYRPVMSRKEGKMRLKDVTNTNRQSPPPREFLAARSSSPVQLPTPRHSSSPTTPPPDHDPTEVQAEIEATSARATAADVDPEAESTGRERRTRKSVNYAEPKLNTKMRKPDGYVSTTHTSKKRSSQSSATLMQRSDSESDVSKPRRSAATTSTATHKLLTSATTTTYMSIVTTDEDNDEEGGTARPPSRTSFNAHSNESGTMKGLQSNTAKRKKTCTTKGYHDYLTDEDEEECEDDEDGAGGADDENGDYQNSSSWVNTDGRKRGFALATARGSERRHSAVV